MKSNFKSTILIAIALITVVASTVLITLFFNNNNSALIHGQGNSNIGSLNLNGQDDWTGFKNDEAVNKKDEYISIPGFDSISLKANQTQQKANFYNPQKNSCYFIISLLLQDGTQLWKSSYLAPSKAFYDINMDTTLDEGEYIAIIKYQCFATADESQPLNGSEIETKLIVKK